MPTGDKSRVDINQMGGQVSSPGGGGRPVSVFEWIGEAAKGVGSACFHTLTGPAAGPLIFAGICAALAYRTKRRARERPLLHRSASIAVLHGGHKTLERILLDPQDARVDRKALDSAAAEMRKRLGEDPTKISYRELHRLAAKLEMSGKEDEAINMLEEEVQKAEKNKHPQEAHELQMLLVEMLIYKGEYKRALACKCLEDDVISDARGPLYKAIIYSIMGDERAKSCYERFQEIRRCFYWCDFLEGTPLYGMVYDFDKFKTITENLKKEIEHAKTENP